MLTEYTAEYMTIWLHPTTSQVPNHAKSYFWTCSVLSSHLIGDHSSVDQFSTEPSCHTPWQVKVGVLTSRLGKTDQRTPSQRVFCYPHIWGSEDFTIHPKINLNYQLIFPSHVPTPLPQGGKGSCPCQRLAQNINPKNLMVGRLNTTESQSSVLNYQ